MNESDKDINGLAFHLADVCGARWERLGPREQAIYRAAAKAGVAAEGGTTCRDRHGCDVEMWCVECLSQELATCLAAPPPEPQAMPPIEPGDWVQDAAGEIRRVMDSDHISWLHANRTIYEIRKANGTVWRRPAPDRSDR